MYLSFENCIELEQPMDEALTRMVEGLAEEFAELPMTVIVRVVTDRSYEFPQAEPEEIARAARADLRREPAAQPPPNP